MSASSGKKKFRTEMDEIIDSMNLAWDNMASSDNNKLANIKRLLDEISFTENFNRQKFDSASALHQKLLGLRPQADNMTDHGIDEYDKATDKLIRETFTLKEETPNIEQHTLAEKLVNEIREADQNLVVFRFRYDRWAKQYNSKIRKNKKQLVRLGEPYRSMKEKPLFELGPQ